MRSACGAQYTARFESFDVLFKRYYATDHVGRTGLHSIPAHCKRVHVEDSFSDNGIVKIEFSLSERSPGVSPRAAKAGSRCMDPRTVTSESNEDSSNAWVAFSSSLSHISLV